MVSPLPNLTVTRIWDSLRRRYKINPSDFENRYKLQQFLKSKGEQLAKTVEKTDFWEKTQGVYKVKGKTTYQQREITYFRSYNKYSPDMETFIKDSQDIVSRKLAVSLNKRFGTTFTASAVQKKRWRLLTGKK